MSGDVRYTTDHAVIRRWVAERGGWPAKFMRIYFPPYAMRGAFPKVRWEDFFRIFEGRRLAFLYQDETPAGQRSHFYRLVQRRPDQNEVGPRSRASAGPGAEPAIAASAR